ncbi:MAG: integrase, partial [Bacteroidota bacterium]
PYSKRTLRSDLKYHRLGEAQLSLLLESGTDLTYIQELLHISKITEIHTRVSTKSIQQIISPFDGL